MIKDNAEVFAVINLDLQRREGHVRDTDGFPSDIKLIFTATLSSRKVWREFVKSTLHPLHSSGYSVAFFLLTNEDTHCLTPFEHSQLLYGIYVHCRIQSVAD